MMFKMKKWMLTFVPALFLSGSIAVAQPPPADVGEKRASFHIQVVINVDDPESERSPKLPGKGRLPPSPETVDPDYSDIGACQVLTKASD